MISGRIIDPAWLLFLGKVDIAPGESEQFDTVARFDNDRECYGWSNETYRMGWRNPNWRLGPGTYLVKITVFSGSARTVKWVRLVNEQEFRLEEI